jgi:cysteine uptake transport protein
MSNDNEYSRSEDLPGKVKLNSEDLGWVAINIGMGIGAGIVFLPVQAGIVGLWTFLIAIFVSYPLLYTFQRLFINTLAESKRCDDYTSIISEFLGNKWGVALGFIYFIMLIIWVFVYSTTITNDSAAYLVKYGISHDLWSANPLYSLLIVVVMVFLAFKSKELLFKISKVLVVIILLSLVALSFLILPYWNLANIMPIDSLWEMSKNIIVTLPFAMTSILFLQSLSPMVIALRNRNKSKEVARMKSIKIMNTSFGILAVIVFFFAFSCTMAISHTEAMEAFNDNTSFLAIIVKDIPGVIIPVIGISIDIFAVMTSFFGVLLGFHEACQGLAINLFYKKLPRELINMRKLSFYIISFIILMAWSAALFNFPILYFTSICSPIFGIVGCFIPVVLVYKSKDLAEYRGMTSYIVFATGVLLVISPFIEFLK